MTSQNDRLRELEIHLSQANFQFLNTVTDPHIVTNYFKRMLREMKNPLIPFKHYNAYGSLTEFPTEEERFAQIKFLVNDMDTLRRATLKFCIEFFRELVSHEEQNLMTSYNVAVTVSPNIFRSRNNRA